MSQQKQVQLSPGYSLACLGLILFPVLLFTTLYLLFEQSSNVTPEEPQEKTEVTKDLVFSEVQLRLSGESENSFWSAETTLSKSSPSLTQPLSYLLDSDSYYYRLNEQDGVKWSVIKDSELNELFRADCSIETWNIASREWQYLNCSSYSTDNNPFYPDTAFSLCYHPITPGLNLLLSSQADSCRYLEELGVTSISIIY